VQMRRLTRNFVRRQANWFKQEDANIQWFDRDQINLDEMEKLAKQIEAVVKTVPGTTSAFAERITGGFYLNIEPDREQLARYGLAVGDLLDVVGTALGGDSGRRTTITMMATISATATAIAPAATRPRMRWRLRRALVREVRAIEEAVSSC